MNLELQGKSVLVTGGSKGIGAAIARALDKAGATVAIADLDVMAAQAVVAGLENGGFAVEVDVTKRDSVERAIDKATESIGGFDLLCANAGVSTMRPAVDITDEEWDFNFDVNAKGVFLVTQAAAPGMIARNSGCIVNTASMAGKKAVPLLAHYAASKWACIGFTKSAAREFGPHNIRVNCVCPGYVRTSMQERELEWEAELRGMTAQAVSDEYISLTPLGRMQTPEDVAKVVLWLCTPGAEFVTGAAIDVTGGANLT